MMSFQSSIH
nr:unnamed protein product [Callosobruchus chinensis]